MQSLLRNTRSTEYVFRPGKQNTHTHTLAKTGNGRPYIHFYCHHRYLAHPGVRATPAPRNQPAFTCGMKWLIQRYGIIWCLFICNAYALLVIGASSLKHLSRAVEWSDVSWHVFLSDHTSIPPTENLYTHAPQLYAEWREPA